MRLFDKLRGERNKNKVPSTRALINAYYEALSSSHWREVIQYGEQVAEIYKKNRSFINESACYTNLGLAYDSLGDFKKAIEYLGKSLQIKKDIGDRAGQSKCYGGLGVTYHHLGDDTKAIECYQRSLEIAKDIGNNTLESEGYRNLFDVYRAKNLYLTNAYKGAFSNSQWKEVIKYAGECAQISRCVGDEQKEYECHIYIGIAYHNIGYSKKAIKYFEKGLQFAKKIRNKLMESNCYMNLGNAYERLENFNDAIEFHKKALDIAEEVGDSPQKSACYTNLGVVYRHLGDFKKEIDFHKKALDIAEEVGDSPQKSACYTNLGLAYDSLGDFDKAIEFYEKSFEIDKEICDKLGQSVCCADLGKAYYSLGDFDKAIEFYEESLKISEDTNSEEQKSTCCMGLGNVYDSLGDFNKAFEYYKEALEIAESIDATDKQRTGNLLIGLSYSKLDKLTEAYEYYQRSIELSEMIAGKLVEERHKIPFFSRISDAYQYMIPLCVKLKRAQEAFEYAERSKSRAFLDLLASTEIKPTINLTAELKSLLNEEEKYLTKIREIQTRHLRQTKITVEPGEVEEIYENLNLIYDKLELFDPEYVFMRRGKPLSLDKLQKMLFSQKGDVVVIEYFTTEKEAFIFLVSSKELHIKTVPISQKNLIQYLQNYQREVVNHPKFGDIGDTWLELSNYLIEPISEYLHEGDLIYFVPYGLLHYFPLHVLELEGEPLIKNHPVAYAPSASLIKFCQNKGSGRLQSCASFGVVFEQEAKDVAELFNTTPCNSYSATKDKARENCTDKDVIHFSCHGRFDNVDPLFSGVKLFDGTLTAREIFDMRLNAELVTLSACQTGLNERSPGDELIGLTRAFLYAGSPSVIVSLWSVEAHSTRELMLEFYARLKSGVDRASALQEAQKKIMKEYKHPYYWAPFILIGKV